MPIVPNIKSPKHIDNNEKYGDINVWMNKQREVENIQSFFPNF